MLSIYWDSIAVELGQEYDAMAAANDWPDYLDIWPAIVGRTDDLTGADGNPPTLAEWLSGLLVVLADLSENGPPGPGWDELVASVGILAHDALSASAAEAADPGWFEAQWHAVKNEVAAAGDPVKKAGQAVQAVADAGADAAGGALDFARQHPGATLAGILAALGLAAVLYAMGPAAALKLIRPR